MILTACHNAKIQRTELKPQLWNLCESVVSNSPIESATLHGTGEFADSQNHETALLPLLKILEFALNKHRPEDLHVYQPD